MTVFSIKSYKNKSNCTEKNSFPKDDFSRELERDLLKTELEFAGVSDPFSQPRSTPQKKFTLEPEDFEGFFVGHIAEQIKRVYPEVPFSTLVGTTLSLLSMGLQYRFKVNADPGFQDHELAIGIFFLGELASGSGKSKIVDLFTQNFKRKALEINVSLDPELYKDAFNAGILTPAKDATNAGMQQILQIYKKSVFSLVSTEKSLLYSMFSRFGTQGDHTMYQDAWEGAAFSTIRATRIFTERRLWAVVCLLTQERVIKELFKNAGDDGLLMRFLISCEEKESLQKEKHLEARKKIKVLNSISDDLKMFYNTTLSGLNFSPSPSGGLDAFWESLEVITPSLEIFQDTKEIELEFKEIGEQKKQNGNKILESFYNKALLHITKIAAVLHSSTEMVSGKSSFNKEFGLESLLLARKIFLYQASIFESWFEKEEIFGPAAEEKEVLDVLLNTKKTLKLKELSLKCQRRKVFLSQKSAEKSTYKLARDRIEAMIVEDKLSICDDGFVSISK